MNDFDHNTTRFVVMARDAKIAQKGTGKTSLMVRAKDIPAALYKLLGGFATHGVSLTKIESYVMDGDFAVAQFYIEVEGYADAPHVAGALEEMAFFASWIKVLGSYPAHTPMAKNT